MERKKKEGVDYAPQLFIITMRKRGKKEKGDNAW